MGPEQTLLIYRGHYERHLVRIAALKDEVEDLRQRLIGGVEGVKAGRDLAQWAATNDKYLRKPRRE
jgi:hypothetical protein